MKQRAKEALDARVANELEFFKNNVSVSGGVRLAGSEPQTKLLSNQLACHIEEVYGKHWLLYLSDIITLYDLSRLEKLHVKELMKIDKTIRQEVRDWARRQNDKEI